MQLESRALGYWLVHNVVPPVGLQVPLAPWVSSSYIGSPVIHPIADCEHPLLCLLGPSIVSQETTICGTFQQNLASVCNGVIVWKLIMGWIPGYGSLYMVHPFVSAPNFVSISPSMGILFPILGRNEVITNWSSFLNFFLCVLEVVSWVF